MKKWGWLGVLALAVVLVGWAVWQLGPEDGRTRKELEKQLYISIPAASQIHCVDDHGGFHGDGVLTAVVVPEGQEDWEALLDEVAGVWQQTPVDETMLEPFQQVWSRHEGQIEPLPEQPQGWWFYRDRYQEQYGEKCEGNPVLQNCTFALLDTGTGRLYVLKCDV